MYVAGAPGPHLPPGPRHIFSLTRKGPVRVDASSAPRSSFRLVTLSGEMSRSISGFGVLDEFTHR